MTFKAGVSGNPSGKKPGCGRLQKLRTSLEKDLPGILATLTTQALAGDPVSARLILDRVLPPLKPETRQSTPMPVDPDGILSAVESGTIGLDQATALMALATSRVKIAEGEELLKRIEALEMLLAAPNSSRPSA
jgi:hypothetical protein